MVRPDQESIDTFMSITGVSEDAAVHKLEEHRGDLNAAVNAHFSEGDRSIAQGVTSLPAPQVDDMDIDNPLSVEALGPPSSLLPDLNPFSLLDANFTRSIFDSGPDVTSQSPFVSHPREVRQIPIEVNDGTRAPVISGSVPVIEDVTETTQANVPGILGTVNMDDDDDDEIISSAPSTLIEPSAPSIIDLPDYSNDIEEEMIRAAIEASKQDAEKSNQQHGDDHDLMDPATRHGKSHMGDELEHAVSLSLQTAEREKGLRGQEEIVEDSKLKALNPSSPKEIEQLPSSNGRPWLEVGSSSVQDEAEDAEELPLVRHRRRRVSSVPADTTENIEEVQDSLPSNPEELNGNGFPSDEWGGISSEEHDEAVMLEAAMFGGIPERSGYNFPYVPRQMMRNGLDRTGVPYPDYMPRPPSPSLTAQRLIREQQDDEYLASLQADREKELKAQEEAEAALAEERRKEEELLRQVQEEQEIQRQLAAKEASLPQEPTPDDENSVNLLVRMPDGSRRGRRFRKSDTLQFLFDFIDVGRVVKPGSYRLVRPYPRRAFGDGESSSTLSELGLTSKQEALYLELI